MPSDNQHNPPDPHPSDLQAHLRALRALRGRLASARPHEQQDALREVLAYAARTKLIAFSTAARLEEIGWPAPDGDLAAAVRTAIADLVLCLVWEAAWPPDDEPSEEEGTGGTERSAPTAPL